MVGTRSVVVPGGVRYMVHGRVLHPAPCTYITEPGTYATEPGTYATEPGTYAARVGQWPLGHDRGLPVLLV